MLFSKKMLHIRYFHFLFVFTLFIIPNTTGQEQSLGRLSECGHQLAGEVFVKNDREIIIKDFHYDGRGPAAWFHAMRKGIKGGVHNSQSSYYYTLPFPSNSCSRVAGKQYSSEEITLVLPVSVKELETIGMLCYQYCHNFGHVTIPPNLNVPAAPPSLVVPPKCPKVYTEQCTAKGGGRETSNGGPNCGPVGPGPSSPPSPTPSNSASTPPNPAPSPSPTKPKPSPVLLLLLLLIHLHITELRPIQGIKWFQSTFSLLFSLFSSSPL